MTSGAIPDSCYAPLTDRQFARLMGLPEIWPVRLQSGDGIVSGVLPEWLIICQSPNQFELRERNPDGTYTSSILSSSVLDFLIQQLSRMRAYRDIPGFSGGIIGWKSYDFNQSCKSSGPGPQLPVAYFGGYDCFFRHDQDRVCLFAPSQELLSLIIRRTDLPGCPESFALDTRFKHHSTLDEYRGVFNRVMHYLHTGDCYQVNLAQLFTARCRGDGHQAFNYLLDQTSPPNAAYFGSCFGEIISLSPELFFRFEDRRVISSPIKGTRPRGRTRDEDADLLRDLSTHPKDRAENLMIVDLLRNDIGKLAETGSVSVEALFETHSFPHIHHMISRISGRLAEGVHPLQMLFDAFPGGSITGAPKLRAMEIIAELEDFRRSIYCGSIGWMTPDGRGEWNIAIRTLLKVDDTIFAWAGGGIVADSVCEDEYQECLNKIGPLLASLEGRFGKD